MKRWRWLLLILPLGLFFAARGAAKWRPVEVARHSGALQISVSPDGKWLADSFPNYSKP